MALYTPPSKPPEPPAGKAKPPATPPKGKSAAETMYPTKK